MHEKRRRRDVIKGIGVAGIVGLAGCTGDDDDGGADDGGGDGTDDSDDGADDGTDDGMDDGSDDGMDDGSEPSEGRTINLGMLMGVTGGLEELGPPIRDAADIVPQQVNEADIPHEVDVQFEDTGTEPGQGIEGAEALRDAGYEALVGALASGVSMPVAQQVAIPNRMVMCSPASTVEEYSNLEGDFTFRTAVPDSFQGQVLANIAASRLDADSAATLAQDDSYGRGLASAFAGSFEDQGGEVTDEVIFPTGEASYTSQIEQALSGDPDTMLIVAFPEDGARIFDDFFSDFDRPDMDILVSDGLQDSGLPGAVGFDMTNVTGTAPIGQGPGLETFKDLYQEARGEDESERAFVRQAYDAAATLVLANAAAGSNTGEDIRDQIRPVTEGEGEVVRPGNIADGVELAADGEDVTYEGVSGEIAYDENGDQGNIAYNYFGFTEDGLETIDTIRL